MPEIPIDLSGCIFILSMNDTIMMDNALISRIPIINVNGYTVDDKIIILQNYILPECIVNYGFKSNDITISKSSAKHLIYRVKEEGEHNGLSGVRSLKYAIDRIIKYINLYRLSKGSHSFTIKLNYSLPFEITNDVIDKFEINDKSTNIYRDSMYK
jgi:ATP-dependent Lon protease